MTKKTRTGIAVLVLCFFALTVFAPLAQGADVVAKPGDNNETVREINTMLKSLGYFYGTVSNTYSTSTKAAVTLFQRANGLTATGTVDQATYEALKAKYTGKTGSGQATPNTGTTPTTNPSTNPSTNTSTKPSTNTSTKPSTNASTRPSTDSSTSPTTTSATVSGLTAQEQQMFNLVNQERAKAGLAPLQIDMRLVESARAKSKDMIANNYFSHTSPVLGGFAGLIRKYAPDYGYVGENLAGNKTVQGAMTAFMNSSGHKKNILSPNYTYIGIGIVSGGPYGMMLTQHFGG